MKCLSRSKQLQNKRTVEAEQLLCHLLHKKHLVSRARYTRSNLERQQPRLCKHKQISGWILKKTSHGRKKAGRQPNRTIPNWTKSSSLAGRRGSVPAVVEGGPGRCQRQTLAELVPLPGDLAELEQDSVQVVAGWPVVVDGWGRGGCLAVHGRACDSEHISSVSTLAKLE